MSPTRADLRRQIYHLELEIERQEAALTANRTLLRELRANLAKDNPTFPILTLPPEIASEIFVHCIPEKPSLPSTKNVPFILLRVCKAWNRIAMSTPALWAKFQLRLSYYAVSQGTTLTKTFESMARRAAQIPLNVVISAHYSVFAASEAFWHTFCAHAHRLQRLEITYVAVEVAAIISTRAPAFPVLAHLSLLGGERETEEHTSLAIFRDAPLLRSVALSCIDLSTVLLPFNNITNLVAGDYHLDEIMDVLRALPNLLVLRYTQFEEVDHDQPPPVDLVHAELCHVYLTESDEEQCSILKYLTLPKLEILVFEATDPALDAEDLDAFFERSRAPLHQLAFGCASNRRTLYIVDWRFLQRVPQTRALQMDYLSEDAIRCFCHDFAMPSLLPGIKNLVLRCRQFCAVDDGDEYEMCREEEDEITMTKFVGLVLDAVEKRVAREEGSPFKLRILTEDANGVGLAALSDKQAQQCREIKSQGVDVWIGPEGRNLVEHAL
ncbi:F-box domain-containing protein [Mycena kentingensis (nom. inval.)]|nr:F-box domain-containing protein [Mycena kentingensis (nom. inval.)]